MNEPAPISVLIKHILELEEACASLYAFYAEVFENNAPAAKVFRQMKREEEGHRNQVDLQRRIIQENPDIFGDNPIDPDEIKQLVLDIEEHIQGGVFDIADALNFAVDLEEHAVEVHYRTCAAKLCPELTALTALLKGGDESHVQRLKSLQRPFL